MIRSFKDARTEALSKGKITKGTPADVAKRAVNKLFLLDTATRLEDLSRVPGNVFEALNGDRAGQYSIGVNQQWRLCFVWKD